MMFFTTLPHFYQFVLKFAQRVKAYDLHLELSMEWVEEEAMEHETSMKQEHVR